MDISFIVFLGICLTFGSTSGEMVSNDDDLNLRIACHMDQHSGLYTHLTKSYAIKVFGFLTPFNGKPEGHHKLCKWLMDHPRKNGPMNCGEMHWRIACHVDRDLPHIGTHLVKHLSMKIYGTSTPFNGKPHEPYVEKICHFLKTIPMGISG